MEPIFTTQDKKQAPAGNLLFPVFLKLEKFRVLIVGAGNVGLEKARAILENNPAVPLTIIGKYILPELAEYCRHFEQVQLIQKSFDAADLEDIAIAIAATDDRSVNTHVKDLARQKGILVNVADTPDECDFYLSSIVKKGDLKIAISTNGKSPTIAKRLKETLQEILPEELDQILQRMPEIRRYLGGDFSHKVRELNALTSGLLKN